MRIQKGFFIHLVGTCADAAEITYNANYVLSLENEVSVYRVGVSNSTEKPRIHYLTLSKKWGISPNIGKKNYKLLLRVILGLFCISLYLEDLGQITELCCIGGCHTMCSEIH